MKDDKLATYIYNIGYMAGHQDTVEGQFTDILSADIDTYHADVVSDLVNEIRGAPIHADVVAAPKCTTIAMDAMHEYFKEQMKLRIDELAILNNKFPGCVAVGDKIAEIQEILESKEGGK